MWLQIAEGALWAGLYVYNRLTAPETPAPVARTRDSLDLPRTEEGTPVPIVFGRCQIKSPVLVWASNLSSVTSPDNAYITYGLYMLFAIGVPMGNGVTRGASLNGPLLHNVWMGDKLLPSPGSLPRVGTKIQQAKQVFQRSFLGGPGRGGGLIGAYQWFGGWTDQDFTSPASPIGDAMAKSNISIGGTPFIPGHRKIMCCSFQYCPMDSSDPYWNQTQPDNVSGTTDAMRLPEGFVLGENPDVNGFAFEVSTYGDITNGVSGHRFAMTTPGFDFSGDADPVEVIFDILTNGWSRLGLDVSKVDLVSFMAASTTLKTENHGYSNVHYQSEDAHSVISGILAQIDAAMYEEPSTGQFVIKLIRQDYSIPSLQIFDENNIDSVEDYSIGAWRDTINEVRIRFTDRANNYSVGAAVAQSMANTVGNNNRRRPKQIDYLGINNKTTAAQVAGRELNVLSTPLSKITIKVNRDGWTIRPGMCFVVNYAEYNISGTVFRATRIDLGSKDDPTVTIDAIQDAFASNYKGQTQTTVNTIFPPYPIVTRPIIEVPKFLLQEAYQAGIINDQDMTRVMALPQANTNDERYYVNTQQSNGAASDSFSQLLVDVPISTFPIRVQLAANYSRLLEPYDTGTNLVVNNLVGIAGNIFNALIATPIQIQTHGANLWCLMRADGQHELIAFESVFGLGGGSYRLVNVWRGLLDTAPLDHVTGEWLYRITPSLVGRRAWSATKPIVGQIVPVGGSQVGTDADVVEVIPNVGPYGNAWTFPNDNKMGFVARAFRPLPAADFAVIGAGCQGTIGLPGVAGRYKSISLLEEEVFLYGIKRELYSPTIKRGDNGVDDTLNSFSTYVWRLTACAAGLHQPQWTAEVGNVSAGSWNNISGITASQAESQSINPHYLAGAGASFDFYGPIEIGLTTTITLLSNSPAVSKAGLAFNQELHSYTDPTVAAFAPSWRNLLGNVRFDVSNFFSGTPFLWDLTSGSSPTIGTGTFSLSTKASGNLSHYVVPGGTTLDISVTAQVQTWNPRGLSAVAIGYIKNANTDTNDTGQLVISDNNGLSAAGAATIGPSGVGASWKRLQTNLTTGPGDNPCELAVEAKSVEVAGTGTANADTCWTEFSLRLGRFQSNVLTNPSFDTNTLTGWTNLVNSFSTGFASGPSAFAAFGGAFATSTLRQEYTLPTAWDGGATAFLTCYRLQNTAGDSGSVTISALDVSNVVLATSTTGVEDLSATLSQWLRRVIFCDIPDGSVKIRVDLVANRAGGAGVSTAFFDEVELWISKDLIPRSRVTLEFPQPSSQQTPRTLAEFQQSFPSVVSPAYVFGGLHFNQQELFWTDQIAHDSGVFTGQFGNATILRSLYQDKAVTYGTSTLDSYAFVRGSGATAVHLAAGHQGYSIGAFALADTFSVAVFYKIDEIGFSAACGIIGRMDLAQGWGLEVNASGNLTAVLRGDGGTSKTVSLATAAADGAMHMAVLVYDGLNLTVYDEVSNGAVSTTGLGEILGTASPCHLRLGRDADDRDVMPGQIARAYIWSSALTPTQVNAMWNYGKDPNGLGLTTTRNNVAWVQGAPDARGAETVFAAATNQIAIPWNTVLTVDDTVGGSTQDGFGGYVDDDMWNCPSYQQSYKRSGYGLAIGRSTSNRIQSWDFNNSSFWFLESGVKTVGIVDVAGRPAGLNIGLSTTLGFFAQGVAVGAVARDLMLVFWARGTVGTNNVAIQLRTSAGTVVQTLNVSMTAAWKRYNVQFTYSGATATCQFRFIDASGSGVLMDFSSVVYVGEQTTTNAQCPLMIPGPAQTIGDVSAQLNSTLPALFNSEGEILVTGSTIYRDPTSSKSPAAGSIVCVQNGSNAKNRREVQMPNSGPAARLAHTDGAASPATVNADVLLWNSWNSVNKVRGRWDRLGLLDPNGSFFAQAATSDQSHSNQHPVTTTGYSGAGRTAIWTNDTTQSTQIKIGAGAASAPEHMLITFVGVQAREEKLP